MKFVQQMIRIRGGIEIATETIGNSDNPAIVLIMGAMNPGHFWYDEFCTRLADHGYFVVRYDNRDCGNSSGFAYVFQPYTLNDMAQDFIDVIDSYKIEKAHVVGLSMGGYIAQILGAEFPGRVTSLTLISTTPDHRPYMAATMGQQYGQKYELPYPDEKLLTYVEHTRWHPPMNFEDIVSNIVEGWKICIEDISPADLQEIEKLVRKTIQQCKTQSWFNHTFACFNSRERNEILGRIHCPTFIIHGVHDKCLPLDHGRKLHELIKSSTLQIIPDMGHMFPLSMSEKFAHMIHEHVKSVSDAIVRDGTACQVSCYS